MQRKPGQQGMERGQLLPAGRQSLPLSPSPISFESISLIESSSGSLAAAKPAKRARRGRVNFILNSLVVKSEENKVVARRAREMFVLKCLSSEAC